MWREWIAVAASGLAQGATFGLWDLLLSAGGATLHLVGREKLPEVFTWSRVIGTAAMCAWILWFVRRQLSRRR